MPLISPDNYFALSAVVIGLAGFGFWVDGTRFGKKASGVAIMLLLAIALSNLKVIPHRSDVYELIWSYGVPVSLPLLLLHMNLRSILLEAGPMLFAFTLAMMGTLLGVIAGLLVLPLGPSAAELAGILAAGFIGGSMNFVAVAQALDFSDSALMTATLAADNVAGSLHMLLAIAIPSVSLLRRWIPSRFTPGDTIHSEHSEEPGWIPFNATHICIALALSFAICAVSLHIASALGVANYQVLFITLITLVVGNIFHRRLEKLHGNFELGKIMMFVLFVTIGAGTDIFVMLDVGLLVFLYAAVVIAVHLTVVLIGAKLMKIDLVEAVIASLACVGGPVAPAAIAASRGWTDLVTPALLVGLFGYAIATFIGVGLTNVIT